MPNDLLTAAFVFECQSRKEGLPVCNSPQVIAHVPSEPFDLVVGLRPIGGINRFVRLKQVEKTVKDFVGKLLAPSLTTWAGRPKQQTHMRNNAAATVGAALSSMATTSTHLLKASVATMMCFFAPCVTRGPYRSMCTRWNGPSGVCQG